VDGLRKYLQMPAISSTTVSQQSFRMQTPHKIRHNFMRSDAFIHYYSADACLLTEACSMFFHGAAFVTTTYLVSLIHSPSLFSTFTSRRWSQCRAFFENIRVRMIVYQESYILPDTCGHRGNDTLFNLRTIASDHLTWVFVFKSLIRAYRYTFYGSD